MIEEEKPKSEDEKISYNEKKNINKPNNKNEKEKNKNAKDDNINDKEKMNKTISKLPHSYEKLKENASNLIKNDIITRRLVVLTNLGKNLERNNFNYNINNTLVRTVHFEDKKNNNEDPTNDNIKKSILLPMINDNIVSEDLSDRNELRKIVGLENNTFLSHIKRDYLKFEDAIFFDQRDYCTIFVHFLKLKNDLINIFCCSYSFAPYTIRFIKFLFFFHFMFYLETLCIGQKYYFEKYFSEEYQNFIDVMKNSNDLSNITITNEETNNKMTFLEKYFSTETIEFTNIHFLYTFKYAFPRVLIPAAISLISYFFTSILSPRRKIMRAYLNPNLKEQEKINKFKKISKNYKTIFIVFGILAFLLMGFFFYSICNYFVIFEDSKYDIPQSFILSGLIRFIFDILLWSIIANIRMLSIDSHNEDFYAFTRGISEIN